MSCLQRASIWGIVALLSGCSQFTSPEVREPFAQPARVEVVQTREQAGMHIAQHVRNTPGLVHASLWVNAGFRDASPSGVAVLAALATAEAAGGDIAVRVIPDGTSFSRTCTTTGLTDCVRELTALLRQRGPSDGELIRARRRLETWRLTALRPQATIDHLALTGLLGSGTSWPEPPSDTGDTPITQEAVSAFLSAHYGPERSALFLLGDLPAPESDLAITDLLRDLPPSEEPRATRPSHTQDNDVQIQMGQENRISIFATAPSRAAALRAAAMLRSRPPHPGLHAHTFAVRGSALVHLSGTVDEAELSSAATAGIHATRRELLFFQQARPLPLAPPTTPEDIARWIGERWATDPVDDSQTREAPTQISVAITVGPIRRDRRERRRRARIQSLNQSVQMAIDIAHSQRAGRFEGETEGLEFQGRSARGAELWIQRRPHASSTTAAVAFVGGAATDPASLHGRAALLAYSLAAECESQAVRPLAVEPFISAERVGLLVRGPGVSAADIVAWAIRCTANAWPSSAAVERGRARLGAQQRASSARYAAITALSISPAQPGVVAPLGTPDTIADIRTDQLHALLRESRVAARVVAAAVGELDIRHTLSLFTTGLSAIPAGDAYEALSPWLRGERIGQARSGEESQGGIVAWRTGPGPLTASSREGRARVRTAAALLGRLTEGRITWMGSGAWTQGGWFAVGISMNPDDTSLLPARAASMRVPTDAAALELERAAEARALSDPSQTVRARLITLGTRPAPASEEPSEPHLILLTR